MPGVYRAPGVYVEELPATDRPVAGVSTSVAAFVDVFAAGPKNTAFKINGPGDFVRTFGGVVDYSEASYAIDQFFLNGGSQAFVVRADVPEPVASKVKVQGKKLAAPAELEDKVQFVATSPGVAGDTLYVAIQGTGGIADTSGGFDVVVASFAAAEAGPPAVTRVLVQETFRGLNATPGDPRYYIDVVTRRSAYVDAVRLADGPPNATGDPVTGRPVTDAKLTDAAWYAKLAGGSDGKVHDPAEVAKGILGDPATATGLWALDGIAPDTFNFMCLPAIGRMAGTDRDKVYAQAAAYCEKHRAMFIADPPLESTWPTTSDQVVTAMNAVKDSFTPHPNVVSYLPNLLVPTSRGTDRLVGPSGTMAGIWARTDTAAGIWKAPAGTEAQLRGARPVTVMTEAASETFNPIGFNVIRTLPVFGNVAWGARTRYGADLQASQWKYVPVRRTALYIEESLRQGLQWVLFEPNDERLWAQIRLNVTAFMHRLFTLGAFASSDPARAYLVKCDADTTNRKDAQAGIVNVLVGFLPQLVTEFVVLKIQQLTLPSEA